ncbi:MULTISPECIES: IMPACT family protein [unclassified Pedobacter]|uniref:IMPACT family protein n=1 Tax=unclassified Pedobacter TaxID=2628915 RepID=UPI00142013EE|nr:MULTISPECIES: YigZ family protein [unclassified Pedobacter]NII82881.1 putative YigZ family protein [Pedobacter sp. SG908]NMN36899.1 putative YigZ family protein [Pedobacter sp. SG918]
MLFDDSYKTIESTSEGIFRDKGSKFMAYAYPIRSEDEVKPLIANLRAEHTKARHFCYAYRLTPDRSVFRVNDDGEPSGTAGRPILNCLLSEDLTNILIVVVRYFGGTLLGVPGLINAYKSASIASIKMSTIISKTVNDVYEVHFEYLQMNEVMKLSKEENLQILGQQFDTDCILKFEVRKAQLNQVLSKFDKIEGVKLKYLQTV